MIPGNVIVYLVGDKLERLYYSEAFAGLSGYDAAEFRILAEQDAFELVFPSDRAAVEKRVREHAADGSDFEITYRLRHRTENFVWVHVRARFIGDIDGVPVLLSLMSATGQEAAPYQELANATIRGVLVVDRESHETLYANETFSRMIGLPVSACMGRECSRSMENITGCRKDICPLDRPRGTEHSPFRCRNDKTNRDYRIEERDIDWGCHSAMAIYVSDVTEKVRKDERLRLASRFQLDAVMRLNPNAASTFRLNLTQDTVEGEFIMFPGLKESADYEGVGECIRDGARRVPHEDEREAFLKAFLPENLLEQYSHGITQVKLQHSFLAGGDVERILSTSACMVRNLMTKNVEAVIYSIDVTKQELDREVMRQLLDKEYEALAVLDVEKGMYNLNTLNLAIEGVRAHEWRDYDKDIALCAKRLLRPDDCADFLVKASRDNISRRLRNHEDFSFTVENKSTPPRLKKVSFLCLDKAHCRALITVEDITAAALKERERVDELRKALDVAENASREKTRFLSRMSHDMRTPLNGILNFARFIDESDNLDDAKRYGGKIRASGDYLQTLINDTLGMSRIESGKVVLDVEPYRYRDFECSILDVMEQRASDKGVALSLVPLDDADTFLLFDKLRLQQIFLNLLNNAIKFTPEGGSVQMRVSLHGMGGEDEFVRFVVSDTGVGMSHEFMEEQLFEPFAQERTGQDNEETGTGLGLSIVKQLVDLMGGTIECESQLGVGTTFTVEFPAKEVEGAAMPDEKGRKTDVLQLKGRRVLLCEDHPLNREIALHLLAKVGCVTDVAENGRLGVQRFLAKPPAFYDVVLMDIRMPEMDGLEATHAIRASNRPDAHSVPIVAMTANAFAEDVDASRKAGMNAHLSKPIVPEELYETLANCL